MSLSGVINTFIFSDHKQFSMGRNVDIFFQFQIFLRCPSVWGNKQNLYMRHKNNFAIMLCYGSVVVVIHTLCRQNDFCMTTLILVDRSFRILNTKIFETEQNTLTCKNNNFYGLLMAHKKWYILFERGFGKYIEFHCNAFFSLWIDCTEIFQ